MILEYLREMRKLAIPINRNQIIWKYLEIVPEKKVGNYLFINFNLEKSYAALKNGIIVL